jgi:hypothetical protein
MPSSDTLFEALNLCVSFGYPAETQQSFFYKTILYAAKKQVCLLVDSFAVWLRRDCPFRLSSLGSETRSAFSS